MTNAWNPNTAAAAPVPSQLQKCVTCGQPLPPPSGAAHFCRLDLTPATPAPPNIVIVPVWL